MDYVEKFKLLLEKCSELKYCVESEPEFVVPLMDYIAHSERKENRNVKDKALMMKNAFRTY